MKLRFEQLKAHLQKSLASIYWISGDELLLSQQACDWIREAAKSTGYQFASPIHLQQDSDWQLLSHHTPNKSLFANKIAYEFRLKSSKLSTVARNVLVSYCEKPPKDQLIIIRSPKLDKSTEKTKWLQNINKIDTKIAIWPLTTKQFPQWLSQKKKKKKLEINTESLALVSHYCEGNLLAAKQELDKLSLIYGAKPIHCEHVASAMSDHSQFDVFSLVDSALAGDAARCQHILQRLRQNHLEPTIILWALAREIRMLAKIAYGLAQGEHYDRLCQQHHIWSQRKTFIHQALASHSAKHFQQLLTKAQQLDLIIKGIKPGHRWDNLLTLTLALANRPLFQKKLRSSC